MPDSGTIQLITGDCLEVMQTMPDDSVDLVVCSSPYEDARLYGEMAYRLKGQAWVDWCVPRFQECVRVCRGLVVWVVEGRTRQFQWSATPALLMADLHRAGVKLRKPPIYRRYGIPGSGGPDWWRNDYEFCVCASKGKLPWSDPTAVGSPPKFKPGGRPSHRITGGDGRVNRPRPLERRPDGSRQVRTYKPPKLANPGNVVDCGAVGGNNMGSRVAHQSEAPFPEKLVEPFILCFCPPGGTVLDPFSGSGTTVAVAARLGRNGIGIDIRASQTAIAQERTGQSSQKEAAA